MIELNIGINSTATISVKGLGLMPALISQTAKDRELREAIEAQRQSSSKGLDVKFFNNPWLGLSFSPIRMSLFNQQSQTRADYYRALSVLQGVQAYTAPNFFSQGLFGSLYSLEHKSEINYGASSKWIKYGLSRGSILDRIPIIGREKREFSKFTRKVMPINLKAREIERLDWEIGKIKTSIEETERQIKAEKDLDAIIEL